MCHKCGIFRKILVTTDLVKTGVIAVLVLYGLWNEKNFRKP